MAQASLDTIYGFIKSVSYPNNKARSLLGMAKMLVDEFGSQVPSDIDSLMRLPGVGRKNSQCDSGRGMEQGGNGGRHACVSC